MPSGRFGQAGENAVGLAENSLEIVEQLRPVGPGHLEEGDLCRFGLVDPLLDLPEALQHDYGVVLAEADVGRHQA